MHWRLGIDLGTNSLGWAALTLEQDENGYFPANVLDAGVRIFSDGRNPKDKQSNAAKRREPRSARKNRDRSQRRKQRLMRQLIEYGLMPVNEADRKALEGGKGIPPEETDPWILRVRGLNEQITPYQLGRAIFHLNQRRGFKSNRKTDRADAAESGKVYEATRRTRAQLEEEGARTLGELFGRPILDTVRHNRTVSKGERKPLPLARVRKSGEGSKWQYDYYPTRDLILTEFDMLWEAQKAYHPDLLNEEARVALRDTIEWQHPLKEQPVGKCTLIPTEQRAPKALPSFQRSRIYQEVNALMIAPAGAARIPLTKEQRNQIADRLLHPTNQTAQVKFDQIRKLLGLSEYDRFNTESDKRTYLVGDETAAKLAHKNRWGNDWYNLDLDTQDEVVNRILHDEDETLLIQNLCDRFGLDTEQAQHVADTPLPAGHGNLSHEALKRILPPLEEDVIVYSDAVRAAGFDSHSQFETGEVFDRKLPYYGYILERSVAFGTGEPTDNDEKRYGKIANPTVHVALNQIRAVVNDLLARFGPPTQIVIELARDLPLSAKGKSELEVRQKRDKDANDERRKRLAEMGQEDTYDNRMRLRLYEDLEALGKRCVFSGEQITASNLFSADVEIEHILPFSRTFDDSYANKTLSMRKANRDKANRTPYEAFGHSPDGYDWETISNRSIELPANKRWRFGPDAMERYEAEEGGFLNRQLTDTQYISRLAKAYLEAIYPGGKRSNVWVIPGRLTADLRWQWGLDSILAGHNTARGDLAEKNRNDHRHHAIDAIVVACTDRRLLKAAADQARKNEESTNGRLMNGIAEPWEGFRDAVERAVRNIIVSAKPDHGIQDAMHNDTAYGIAKGTDGEPDRRGTRLVVTRKPLDSDAFKKPDDLEKIRDQSIRTTLMNATEGLSGKDFKTALLNAARALSPPVYKTRIIERLNVIPIHDKSGAPFKAYKGDGNYCYDIWVDEKGKWTGEVISTFDAYQLAQTDPTWWRKNVGREGQKLLMRLRKNDYLRITEDGTEKIVQVYKFTDGTINMAEHHEANASARIRNAQLPPIAKAPSALQKIHAKRVTISPSGVLHVYEPDG